MTTDRDDHEARADSAPRRAPTPLTRLELPRRWMPEQAELIFEFLAELADAFFLAHDQVRIEIAGREALEPGPYDADDDFDEDLIPF